MAGNHDITADDVPASAGPAVASSGDPGGVSLGFNLGNLLSSPTDGSGFGGTGSKGLTTAQINAQRPAPPDPWAAFTGLTTSGAYGTMYAPFGAPASRSTLQDLIGKNQAFQSSNVQGLQSLESANPSKSGQPSNLLKDLSYNTIGQFALLNRLEAQFGPEFRNNPQAAAILNSFNNQVTASYDMDALHKALDMSNSIYDYVTSPVGQGIKI